MARKPRAIIRPVYGEMTRAYLRRTLWLPGPIRPAQLPQYYGDVYSIQQRMRGVRIR